MGRKKKEEKVVEESAEVKLSKREKQRQAYLAQLRKDYDEIHGPGSYDERVAEHEDPGVLPISAMKMLVRTFYDLQSIRMSFGNRISKAGKLTNTITGAVEDKLLGYFDEITATEKKVLKDISTELKNHPIWTEYLIHIKGIGPTMAGALVSEIGNILRFATVSKLWMYCGYGLRLAEKNGFAIQQLRKGEKITWNPLLKAKLHILGESLLKQNNPRYRKIYDEYKHRISNMPCSKAPVDHLNNEEKAKPNREEVLKAKLDAFGCTKGHRHAKALRYMIKIFLIDLYATWWKLEGQTPRPPYQEEKLGHVHHETAGVAT